MDSSKKVYNQYNHNGKTFLYSKKLRVVNKQILNLITSDNLVKNKKLKKPFLDLKKHLEEWINSWDKEKDIRTPKDNDTFIFTGYKKYPKDLELLLIKSAKNTS